MDNRLNWDDARPFLTVARMGTLSAAAAHLNIGVATLSRRIDRLEVALGVALFIRGQSGYQLTEDGEVLIESAEAVESASLAFSSIAVSRSEISGVVRVATAETLASEIIIPVLPRFAHLYPKLKVEVVTEAFTANLHRRDADLALRMVKPERGNLLLQRVGTLGWGLYAQDGYLHRRPVGEADLTLADHSLISWSDTLMHLEVAQWVERVAPQATRVVTASSLLGQVAAAKAGLGIAALPHYLGRSAGLRRVRTNIDICQSIYLVGQSNVMQSAKVRVMWNFLREIMSEKRLLFASQ